MYQKLDSVKSTSIVERGFKEEKNEPLISVLMNSVYFFLEHAFIVSDKNNYRLFVRHRNEVLADQDYKSLRGAKIAFSKLFQQNAFDKDYSHPQWSPLYTPERNWLYKNFQSFLEPSCMM